MCCGLVSCGDATSPDPIALCVNGVLDEGEADVDCGGANCGPCEPGQGCEGASDCDSGVCSAGACAQPECGDGVTNGTEPCDDGEDSANCNLDCTTTACGDAYVNAAAGEECAVDTATCDAN